MTCKCKRCGAEIDELAVFPGGICVDCHAKKFDEQVRRTGQLPVPEFGKRSLARRA
jgi:hypothetical protein